MKLSLLAVGKVKTPHWAAAQEDYVQRIRRYATLNVVEVKDRIGQGLNDKAAMEKEGTEMLFAAQGIPAIIVLTPIGKLLDSPAWADTLRRLTDTYPQVAFVIGGPVGLSEKVTKKSRMQLALSSMTFPHELARVIFLEQLYRALTILGGEKYHK